MPATEASVTDGEEEEEAAALSPPLRSNSIMDDPDLLEVKDIVQKTLESQGLLNQLRVSPLLSSSSSSS